MSVTVGRLGFRVSGTDAFVTEMRGEFGWLLDRMRVEAADPSAAPAAVARPAAGNGGDPAGPPARPAGPRAAAAAVPEEFGEYLLLFKRDVTDVDRVLIAAAFVQHTDEDKAFTTRQANELLQEQGVKVSNASECVRRCVATRRVFPLTGGKRYRVSQSGREHLDALREGADD